MFTLRKNTPNLFRAMLWNNFRLIPVSTQLMSYSRNIPSQNVIKDHRINYVSRSNFAKLKFSASVEEEKEINQDKPLSQETIKRAVPIIDSAGKSYKYSVGYSETKYFENERLKEISQEIANLTSLQDLQLSLWSCEKITDEGLKSLAESLRALNTLENIELNLSSCKSITSDGIKSLTKSIGQLTSLKSLTLNLPSSSQLSDNDLVSISETLGKMTSLRSINLKLPLQHEISEIGIASLGKNLRSLPLLTDLAFDVSNSNKDEAIKVLSQSLPHLKSLQRLDLSFSLRSKIDDELIALSEALRRMNSLQHLSLDFQT